MALLRTMKPSALRQMFAALAAWWQSFAYLKRHKLRAYHGVGPGAIALLTCLGWALTTGLQSAAEGALHRALASAGLSNQASETVATGFWHTALSWGVSQLEWMLHWGIVVLVFWLKVKVTKYLLLTLVAPFMSLLAAAIQDKETGQSTPLSPTTILRDLWRGIRTALTLFVLEIGLSIAFTLLGLMLAAVAPPLAVLLSPVLLVLAWLVGSYFYGAAVFDAIFEQQGLDWRTSIRAGWQQKGHLTGMGMVFSLLMAIPIAGPFLAAVLGPIPCTAAAAKLTYTTSPPLETPT